MKVAAHPMVVAVALGLLGPEALDEDSDDPRPAAEGSTQALGVADPPSEAEFQRVEGLWLAARAGLDVRG